MHLERKDGQKPIYNPLRALEIANLSLDVGSGWAKRSDNGKFIHFTHGEVTFLRIFDRKGFVTIPEIALQYEQTEMLNKALDSAFFYKTHPWHLSIDRINPTNILLDDIDSLYGDDPLALETSDELIRVFIWQIRKKMGYDSIEIEERKKGSGYRLRDPNGFSSDSVSD